MLVSSELILSEELNTQILIFSEKLNVSRLQRSSFKAFCLKLLSLVSQPQCTGVTALLQPNLDLKVHKW